MEMLIEVLIEELARVRVVPLHVGLRLGVQATQIQQLVVREGPLLGFFQRESHDG